MSIISILLFWIKCSWKISQNPFKHVYTGCAQLNWLSTLAWQKLTKAVKYSYQLVIQDLIADRVPKWTLIKYMEHQAKTIYLCWKQVNWLWTKNMKSTFMSTHNACIDLMNLSKKVTLNKTIVLTCILSHCDRDPLLINVPYQLLISGETKIHHEINNFCPIQISLQQIIHKCYHVR